MSRITRPGSTRPFGAIVIVGFVAACLLFVALPAFALFPPPPPPPPGGFPPGPPPDDYPGATPGNENVILPVPETTVYDTVNVEPNGYFTSTEIDPVSGEPVTRTYANDELLVVFTPEATSTEIDQALQGVGAWNKEWNQWVDRWAVGFDPVDTLEDLQAKASQLSLSSIVVSVAKSEASAPATISPPNDPLVVANPTYWQVDGQWALRRMGLCWATGGFWPAAWEVQKGKGAYATVGVVDSGVDKTHVDLQQNLRTESDTYSSSIYNHGTCTTGIIAAVTNNGNQLAGMGWDCNSNGQFISTWGVRAISKRAGNNSYQWKDVVNRTADVLRYTTPGGVVAINYSITGPSNDASLETMVIDAVNRGTLVVAAAGNDGKRTINYPAGYTRAMAVGATKCHCFGWDDQTPFIEPEEIMTDLSTWGPNLSVVAPGDAITTTMPGSQYTSSFDGTSAATPFVTGLAALVRSQYQSMGPLDIRFRIEDTATNRVLARDWQTTNPNRYFSDSWDEYAGWGFCRANNALCSAHYNSHTYGGTAALTFQPNKWYLVTIPVWPMENPNLTQWQSSTFPQNVLPPAPAGGIREIAAVKPGTNDYYVQSQYDGNGYPLIGLVKPYRGFWVRYRNTTSAVTCNAMGAIAGVKLGHDYEFPLPRGVNMVGNPFLYGPLYYVDGWVSFRQQVGTTLQTKSLTQAVIAGWIDSRSYIWSPDANQYLQLYAGNTVPPYTGMFMKTYVDGLTMVAKSPSILY
jgi:hypothetical protein